MTVQSDIPNKKNSILKSTLQLINTNGFHGTPVSKIARNAGVASGTIYHYFPSKDTIIIELYNLIKNEMRAAMFNEANNKKEYKSQFFIGWTNLCKYFINNPASLTFLEQYNSSPYSKTKKKGLKEPPNKFNEFFQFGMDNGYLKKMEYNLIASVVFGCITATAKYHVTGRFDFTDTDLCKIANILWDGIKNGNSSDDKKN